MKRARRRNFGPLADVPITLSKRFPVYVGTGDQDDVANHEFVWGDISTDLLDRANKRLRWYWRRIERIDRWRARLKAFAPAVHDDVWKWIIGLGCGIVGFLLGRAT